MAKKKTKKNNNNSAANNVRKEEPAKTQETLKEDTAAENGEESLLDKEAAPAAESEEKAADVPAENDLPDADKESTDTPGEDSEPVNISKENESEQKNEQSETKITETTDTPDTTGTVEKAEEAAEDTEPELADSVTENEKPLLPRKRKIVKNNQLAISLCLVIVALAVLFVWKAFFNHSLTGKWYYVHDGEYSETLDDPVASNDPIEQVTNFTQRVVYEFDDDGTCSVTLGTMSVTGGYSTYQTEDGTVLSASVYYQYMPLLYGSYKYDITGNIFTGRKLIIHGTDSSSDIVLEQGEGQNPLKRYEDEKLDERLTGKWKDPEFEQYYTFTNDGHMIIEIEGRLRIDHVYTVFDDGLLLTKYYADTEQTYSYSYSFDDGDLSINGTKLMKIE